jgi:hypothetical protein
VESRTLPDDRGDQSKEQRDRAEDRRSIPRRSPTLGFTVLKDSLSETTSGLTFVEEEMKTLGVNDDETGDDHR